MSFTLTTTFDDCFEFKDKAFTVDMSFDNILLLFEMFDDEGLYEDEKVYVALQMLINEFDNLEFDTHEEAYELFKYVLNEFLDIDLDKQSESEEKQVKMYDFVKDAELIYASFFAVYKLDLFNLKGNLHWRKFEVLLTHLDDNSPFKQVIGYRTMKIPSEKEASKEYRDHVRKMKEIYNLDDSDPEENIENAFNALSHAFKGGG
ncbi:Gp15 family bacteriophage protein [Metabacillus bambusae]|uniref:Bacteriophage Gp15 protein n=1 Tax=Metabacillus bambusae TaxID=2795218 RepID=A0ABS3NBM1_9BACI|nr:Gp15 family bacteriophage protein [Metabacillus bambusae]MBO1515607.1 hypothetical protein [Metabacillus bambusae]